WESGGAEELRTTLARFRAVTHASAAILTDASGTDLLTGEPHSDLVRDAKKLKLFPSSRRGGTTFARLSGDDKYYFFLIRQNWYFWYLQPAHLLVLLLAVLLCYAL